MISKQRGFSLIEVMVVFVMIAVAALGLIKLQTDVQIKSEFAKMSMQSLHLAESQLEHFRQRGPSSATPSYALPDVHSQCNAMTKNAATLAIQLSCQSNLSLSNTLSSIKVTVYWLDRQKTEQSLVLKTMLSQYSEFD